MSSAPQSKNHPGKKHPKGEKPHPKKKGAPKKKTAQQPKKQYKRKKQGGVADKARRMNGRNSKGISNPSPMGVHTKRDVSLNWQNSEAATVTNIKIAPTNVSGDILFQSPLKVDSYPGSLLDREMVQWEKWKMREWGFSFGSLRSKMESGAVIAFYEPDPKIIHTAGDALVKYAYAHSTKLKISAFDNKVFTIRPPPGDHTERYCLSKSSDERLTSYGTFYVVYLGGSAVTSETSIWTLEHHQRIDWFMRDMDPAAGGAGFNGANEGTTHTPTVDDLLLDMTFTPGGIEPRIENGKLILEPANIGTGNNVLVTTISEFMNNAGVSIPLSTETTIEGTVHDLCEAIDDFAPQAIGEMAAQAICGGNTLCKMAVRGVTAAASAFGAQQVRTYMAVLPGEITSLAHPDLARYQPAALGEMERRNLTRRLAQKKLTSKPGEMSTLIYDRIPVADLLSAFSGTATSEEVTTFFNAHELANTGMKVSAVRATALETGPTRRLFELDFFLRGAAIGDAFFFVTRANATNNAVSSTIEPFTGGLTSVNKRWWSAGGTIGQYFMVAGVVASSESNFEVHVRLQFPQGTEWAVLENQGWMDVELYYAASAASVVSKLKTKYPIALDRKGNLSIDEWKVGAGIFNTGNIDFVGTQLYNKLPLTIDDHAETVNTGIFLNYDGSWVMLRNFPTELTGWLHCHYYCQRNAAITYSPITTLGTRWDSGSTSLVIPDSPNNAVVMFKGKIMPGTGEIGLGFHIPTLISNVTVSNFLFAFSETEEEAIEAEEAFLDARKVKRTSRISGFHHV